jgi:hypothetical protein
MDYEATMSAGPAIGIQENLALQQPAPETQRCAKKLVLPKDDAVRPPIGRVGG